MLTVLCTLSTAFMFIIILKKYGNVKNAVENFYFICAEEAPCVDGNGQKSNKTSGQEARSSKKVVLKNDFF